MSWGFTLGDCGINVSSDAWFSDGWWGGSGGSRAPWEQGDQGPLQKRKLEAG